jgi:hypothetical protein
VKPLLRLDLRELSELLRLRDMIEFPRMVNVAGIPNECFVHIHSGPGFFTHDWITP